MKREASERRANALGATSFVRGRNADRGTYQPIYNIFQKIAEAQIEIWDSLLTTLNSIDPNDLESFDPSDLDSARYLLRHCGWLGEQALSTLPDLTRQRRQAERRNQARAAWGCVGLRGHHRTCRLDWWSGGILSLSSVRGGVHGGDTRSASNTVFGLERPCHRSRCHLLSAGRR